MYGFHLTREPLLKGMLSTVDLLVLTSLHKLLFILEKLFTFSTQQATLTRRSTVLSLPLQFVFPEFLRKIGLHHSPDGITNPKEKLLRFITTKFFCKEKNALAFNRDRCCHLALCLWLIPFHCNTTKLRHEKSGQNNF